MYVQVSVYQASSNADEDKVKTDKNDICGSNYHYYAIWHSFKSHVVEVRTHINISTSQIS